MSHPKETEGDRVYQTNPTCSSIFSKKIVFEAAAENADILASGKVWNTRRVQAV